MPQFDLTQPSLDQWQARNHIAAITQTPAGVAIDAAGDDPHFETTPLSFAPDTPLILRLRVRSQESGMLQIFYYPDSGGASEANSVRLQLKGGGAWQDLWVPVPALGPNTRFRIDPPSDKGRTVIAALNFESLTAALAKATQPRSPQGRVLANQWQRLVIAADGAIVSWQARLAQDVGGERVHATPFSPALAYRLSWTRDGAALSNTWRWTQTAAALNAVDAGGNRLEISLRGPQMTYVWRPATATAAQLQMVAPFINEGYFDRATGRNFKPDLGPLGGWTHFTSLVSGDIITVERLKRSRATAAISSIHAQYTPRHEQSLRMATRFGFDIIADGLIMAQPINFTPGFDSLVMEQTLPARREHRFAARVQASAPTVRLANGKALPRFSVEPDTVVVNGAGTRLSLNDLLRDFYHETAFWWVSGNGGIWSDWTALELGFADTPYRDNLRRSISDWIVGNDGYGHDGYAYTWGDQRGWPFGPPDSRHLDSNAVLINGAWRLYCWTGDKAMFTQMVDNSSSPHASQPTRPGLPPRDTLLNKMRRAMQYQLTWWNGAEEGIIHASGKEGDPWHHGRGGGDEKAGGGSNYYDIMPFGGKDAYASIQFYLSLRAMSQVEALLGNAPRAAYLRGLMPKARGAFNRTFWLDHQGNGDGASRYAGNVDADGKANDYGFTFLNTMAMEAGLASPTQTHAIYDWLDNGVSVGPNGEKNHDIYAKWKFGARSSTVFNPAWYSYKAGHWPWNDQLQNGGADLYEAGYDIIARARFKGADDAWQRYTAMLARYAEPDRLSGGGRLWDGAAVQGGESGAGSVGVMFSEFPECGVAAASFLYAFLGVETSANGLVITPRVPHSLHLVRAQNLDFHGATFDLEATRDALLIRCSSNPNHKTFWVNGKPANGPAGVFEVKVPLRAKAPIRLSDSL